MILPEAACPLSTLRPRRGARSGAANLRLLTPRAPLPPGFPRCLLGAGCLMPAPSISLDVPSHRGNNSEGRQDRAPWGPSPAAGAPEYPQALGPCIPGRRAAPPEPPARVGRVIEAGLIGLVWAKALPHCGQNGLGRRACRPCPAPSPWTKDPDSPQKLAGPVGLGPMPTTCGPFPRGSPRAPGTLGLPPQPEPGAAHCVPSLTAQGHEPPAPHPAWSLGERRWRPVSGAGDGAVGPGLWERMVSYCGWLSRKAEVRG